MPVDFTVALILKLTSVVLAIKKIMKETSHNSHEQADHLILDQYFGGNSSKTAVSRV